MIRPYLNDIINNYKTQGEWKIQLTMSINFISSKDFDETRTIHTKSDNINIMLDSATDEIFEKHFESLLQKYQEELEEKMRGSEFVFVCGDILNCNLNKISLNRGGSYIDFLKWLKNKKATINPKKNDNKCFQYARTIALNYQNVKKSSKNFKN